STVTGTVTYGGETVTVGTLTFHPEQGNGVTVEIVDGEYTAEKVPAGSVTVTVSTARQRQTYNNMKSKKDSGQQGAGALPGGSGQVQGIKDKQKDKAKPSMPGMSAEEQK